MAIRYAFDLYPRLDPRDGTVIRRFEHLQEAAYKGEENGTGSGQFTIHGGSADAEDIDPLGLDYVRVIEIDNEDDERVVGGFFLDSGDYEALTRKETRKLTLGGAGTLSYLQRAVMWSRTYIHDVFTGQDPIGETWNLANQSTFYANGNHLGAMLWRVIYEAQHFRSGSYTHRHFDGVEHTGTHSDDRTESAIPDLIMTFDQNEDSDGNPWTVTAGTFTAQVGESVLDVVRRLMELGLKVEMDPDTFELRAWEAPHRTDRTSGSWAANKVRFQAPTGQDVATSNILSDTTRKIRPYIQRSVVLAGGQNSYAISQGSNEPPWEGGYRLDTSETTTPTSVASRQRLARSDAVDNVKLVFKLGDDELDGYYRPWDHVSPGDLVTLHTGTDQWEYNNQTFPVAGLIVELKQGGDWRGIVELGSSFTSLLEPAFRTGGSPAHTHPPNPQLCVAGQTAPAVFHDSLLDITDGSALHPDYSHPGGDFTFIAFTWGSADDLSPVPRWMYDLNGTGPDQEQSFVAVDTSASPGIWILNSPNASVGSGTEFRLSGGSNDDGFLLAVAVVRGTFDAGDLRDWARANGSGTSSSVSVDTQPGDLIIDFVEYDQNNLPGFVLDPTAGQTEDETATLNQAFGQRDVATSIGHLAAGGGTEVLTWGNFSASGPWDAAAVVIPGTGITGDGPIELVGSAVRAARCDHNHLVEELLTDEDDTSLRLAPDGTGGVEWSVTTTVLDLDDLTDVTITAPAADEMLQYIGGVWVNSSRRWEPLTDNPGSGPEMVFDGDDLVLEWVEY